MKVIIPMSGAGSRFVDAGYKDLKPLIKVNGKPIIEWVVSMFPGAEDFTFICQEEHLNTTPLREVLERIAFKSQVISIKSHKQGPVFALKQAFHAIQDSSPYIVSYCDYYMHWSFEDFQQQLEIFECDGSVPCYTGFHPHLIPASNLYAGCRIDKDKWLLEIKEKHSFEKDKTKGHHSPGVYYFKSGQLLKTYCEKIISKNFHLNGEYYVSMLYELMLQDQLKIYVYDKIPHFCQWGTPQDLQDFNFWTEKLEGIL
jgi:NDP-sugar pyrophosphorylase family protein